MTEINLQGEFLSHEPIETIYFGGGSPSLLTPEELSYIIQALQNNFNIKQDAEITVEGNPDDLSLGYLIDLKGLGANRLSIGIQSFDENTLKFLNRVHNASQSYMCLEAALTAGFTNFSIDLIYGIPSTSHKIWKADLELVAKYNPNHVSAYCLTIEENTAFGNWQKKGKLKPIDEEFAAEQYELLVYGLEASGYEQYEISNFALPTFYSKHNSSYWKQKKYLGIGPGAHSYNGINRRYNVSDNIKYMRSIDAGIIPYTEEILTTTDRINEYLLTTLRTSWGCDLTYFEEEFQFDFLTKQSTIINTFLDLGLILLAGNHLCLTKKGKLFADKITSDLFINSD